MKRAFAGVAALLLSGAALAQTTAQNPAQIPSPGAASGLPPPPTAQAGADLPPGAATGPAPFDETQARSRIEAKGFTNVTGLARREDGLWTGKAIEGGTTHEVALDREGKVFSRPKRDPTAWKASQ